MRKIIIIAYCLILFVTQLVAQTQTDITPKQLRETLYQLDDDIAHKLDYRAQRQQFTDSLHSIVARSHGRQLVDLYLELEEQYSRFQSDSALYFLNLITQHPTYDSDLHLQHTVTIRYADVYAVVGLYNAAMEMLKIIEPAQLDEATKLAYFHTSRTVYGWMADYISVKELSDTYKELTQQYRDSILRYELPGIGRDIVMADMFIERNQADSALHLLLDDYEKSQGTERAYVSYNLAVAHQQKQQRTAFLYYLAQTAVTDLRRGVTEYVALPMLAAELYKDGDIERAYKYMLCSMEDANFCKARLRALEAGSIFPIIDKAYKQKESMQRTRERMTMAILALFALTVMGAFIHLRKLAKKLAHSRRQIANSNTLLVNSNQQLENANRQLTATDRLKDEYIAFYLGQCRSYIDSFDQFRRSLLKLAKYKQTDELMKQLIKSDAFVEDEQQRFLMQFDKAFLDIHPKFVEHFNAMLREDAVIQLRQGELLNTELRIFALIRLGVADTSEIAHFLNCSTTTVYNYRSRIRNNSVLDKSEFERRLMTL